MIVVLKKVHPNFVETLSSLLVPDSWGSDLETVTRRLETMWKEGKADEFKNSTVYFKEALKWEGFKEVENYSVEVYLD
jgi:hypothetical protein